MNIEKFDFTTKLNDALLWHKNNATNLQGLIAGLQSYAEANFSAFWQDFYTNIFNLDTANDFGLSVWAIILKVPLNTQKDFPRAGRPIFGFGAASQTYRKKNFNNGNFSPINDANLLLLTIEERRLVLKIRYYQLISRGSIPEINTFLNRIGAKIHVLDGLDMTMTYVFDKSYRYTLINFLLKYDILPRPAGVKLKTYIKGKKIFGFGAPQQKTRKTNFDRGNFQWQ